MNHIKKKESERNEAENKKDIPRNPNHQKVKIMLIIFCIVNFFRNFWGINFNSISQTRKSLPNIPRFVYVPEHLEIITWKAWGYWRVLVPITVILVIIFVGESNISPSYYIQSPGLLRLLLTTMVSWTFWIQYHLGNFQKILVISPSWNFSDFSPMIRQKLGISKE